MCKGELYEHLTEYIENKKSNVVLIKDVPCTKCKQCGETYFNNETVLMLERILNQVHYNGSEVSLTVLDYIKNAA
jgi:YgiT-type zinc finger domain-containing protein